MKSIHARLAGAPLGWAVQNSADEGWTLAALVGGLQAAVGS